MKKDKKTVKNPKVAVIMSTYNGEKYVSEQLNSILNQTYKDIEIYIRDDGSKDGTLNILKEYEKKNSNIHVFFGENVGFIKSFFECLSYCKVADYYAFSDQDDVWLENKIQRAVRMLNKMDKNKALLYFSDYDYYDDNMNFIAHSKSHKKGPSFRNALVDCINLGINTVINKVTRDIMIESNFKKSCGHDWTAYMICAGMGDIIYDKTSTLKYRRTGNNVSPGGMSFIKMQIWRFKKFFVNNYFSNVKEELIEYEEIFKDKLKDEDRKLLSLFTSKKYNFSKMIKRVFYPKMFRQKLTDEIMLRMIILIGKL